MTAMLMQTHQQECILMFNHGFNDSMLNCRNYVTWRNLIDALISLLEALDC